MWNDMKTIEIAKSIGTDLRTRSFFRRDIDRLLDAENSIQLDFTGVVFISRSVADEIYNVLEDNPNCNIVGMEGDVLKMYGIVEKGRMRPRVFSDHKIKTIQLRNMKEVENYFMTL